MTKVQIILLFFLAASTLSQGQDVHFSQYSFSSSFLSPALSNSFDSEFRGGAIYRNQWASVPVSYSSFFGFFDKKIFKSFAGNTFAYGASFQFDKAGDAGLGSMQVRLNGTASRRLTSFVVASFGFGAGYSSRQYSPEKLTFGSQFTDSYQPGLSSGEIFKKTSVGYLDLSVGLNANFDIHKRYKADVGASFSHFNQPKINFQEEEITQLPNLNIYLFGNALLSENVDILFNTVFRDQTPYSELVISSGLKYYLNKQINNELAISFLMGLRKKDGFFPELHLYYKNWTGGISYDRNTSDFKVATAGQGGPELSLTYKANTIPPPKKTKLCPIF